MKKVRCSHTSSAATALCRVLAAGTFFQPGAAWPSVWAFQERVFLETPILSITSRTSDERWIHAGTMKNAHVNIIISGCCVE